MPSGVNLHIIGSNPISTHRLCRPAGIRTLFCSVLETKCLTNGSDLRREHCSTSLDVLQ